MTASAASKTPFLLCGLPHRHITERLSSPDKGDNAEASAHHHGWHACSRIFTASNNQHSSSGISTRTRSSSWATKAKGRAKYASCACAPLARNQGAIKMSPCVKSSGSAIVSQPSSQFIMAQSARSSAWRRVAQSREALVVARFMRE